MGLLDSILGSVLGGGNGQSQNSGQAALINAVIQMVANRGGGAGGLAGLVQSLTQGGLGHAANSWVGTGQNVPVSPDQITSALGGVNDGGVLAQLAQAAGMSHGEAASGLSQILPGLVDKLTPDGQVPQQDTLENMLGSLSIGR
ncbi:MAG TPA: YidB family protein [Burkholderiales bacterium]|nr:YidB family protein [Burkholderiales bacterium]